MNASLVLHNGRSGISVHPTCPHPVCNPSIGAAESITHNSVVDFNGWGLNTCDAICTCSTSTGINDIDSLGSVGGVAASKAITSTPYTVLEQAGITVNCKGVQLFYDDIKEIPIDTTELLLAETNAYWASLPRAITQLPALFHLYLSRNPYLDPLPSDASFRGTALTKLRALLAQGTNLSRLEPDSFRGLEIELQYLDLSFPSVFPARSALVLNFTGFSKLQSVLWYDRDCPPGFYSTAGRQGYSVRPGVDVLNVCGRCPPGTYWPLPGGMAVTVCALCGAGTYDDDRDPTTPCAPMPSLKVTSFSRNSQSFEGGHEFETLVVAFGSLVTVDPVTIEAFEHAPFGNITDGDRGLTFSATEIPPGVLLDPRSGLLRGSPEQKPATLGGHIRYNTTVSVGDGKGQTAIVTKCPIEVRFADRDHSKNGPNGRGCGPGRVVDLIPFDRQFDCDCSDTAYSGINCDNPRPNVALYAVAAVSGIVLLAGLLAAILVLRRARSRNAPYDFTKLLEDFSERTIEVSLDRQQLEGSVPGHDRGQSRLPSPKEPRSILMGIVPNPAFGAGIDRTLVQDPQSHYPELGYRIGQGSTTRPKQIRRSRVVGAVRCGRAGLESDAEIGSSPRQPPVQCGTASNRPREIDETSITLLERLGGGVCADVFAANFSDSSTKAGFDTGFRRARDASRSQGRSRDTSSDGVSAPTMVAVKRPAELGVLDAESARKMLLGEAALAVQFSHPHVVKLLGVITRYCRCDIIYELCVHGDLLGALRRETLHPGAEFITTDAVLAVARDVASGMDYLSGRGYVHRDLAARNVLISHGWSCKVGDFGLARRLLAGKEYYRIRAESDDPLPLRWSAPEVLSRSQFSTSSDVWSYGMVVYETCTRGRHPFAGCTNARTHELLIDTSSAAIKRWLPQPMHIESNVYDLLQRCWSVHPPDRPGFRAILDWIYEHSTGKPLSVCRMEAASVSAATNVIIGSTGDYLRPTRGFARARQRLQPDVTSSDWSSGSSGSAGLHGASRQRQQHAPNLKSFRARTSDLTAGIDQDSYSHESADLSPPSGPASDRGEWPSTGLGLTYDSSGASCETHALLPDRQ